MNLVLYLNILGHIIIHHKRKKVIEILNKYPAKYENIIMEYLIYLKENRFALFVKKNDLDLFPDLSYEWDFPSEISNAIIDIDISGEFINHYDIIDQLDEINCFHLQIRFCDGERDRNKILKLLRYASGKSFHSMSVFLSFKVFKNYTSHKKLIENFPKIDNITVYSSPVKKVIRIEKFWAFINYSINNFDAEKTCGYTNTDFFSLRMEHFTESQHYNTCLNRKISVDSNGYIKNCPAMGQNYGNISCTNLKEVIENPDFKYYRDIKKDNIDVCKDCEFRHICTDCRAFIKDPGNIFSQPSNCNYNPYIAKWKGQNGWMSVEQWRSENQN